ncbi:MAG: hypothetical protein NT108_00175 [Candidatus Kaiserbacteria bacterium]|nr:hypothetical protein [Candidatus Kaiserbacteria bacterium]
MIKVKEFIKNNKPAIVLGVIVLLLTTIPVLETVFVTGNSWRGILPPLTDDIYEARLHTIGEGHLSAGNPYYLEHSDGPPLVIFGGAWLNAIPLWMGYSLPTAMVVNFIIWSLLFAASLYWLFRELRVKPWMAVIGTVFIYIQSSAHIWRPINMQTVYPFYFLFYIALLRIIREQDRKNILFLSVVTGATFYFYAYLWQTAIITLGILCFYALFRKNWSLLRATALSSCIGGVIGLPVPLYALWLSHSSPYFWESVGRLGLVNTHLPMAEVIYSGGWIGIVLAFLAVLYWRVRVLSEDGEFIILASFVSISGLGLWVMEGSNLITGKLLETGEHMPGLIFPWLAFIIFSLGMFVWKQRGLFSRWIKLLSVIVFILLAGVSIRYTSRAVGPFVGPNVNRDVWQSDQQYSKPFTWLQNNEQDPVVVWSNPRSAPAFILSTYTRHFTLDVYWGMLELVPEGEIRERYLISQYFNNLTIEDLKSGREMTLYLGRRDTAHQAKTIERGIKICRILFFWNKNKDCGVVPTSQSLLGDNFFIDLEKKFRTDIKPNIKAYLEKYHVSYILKDKVLDPSYQPKKLGALLVYSDERFELYKLQQ